MSSYRRRLMLANQTEENLVLYGNSVQDGTPTPEAPIDIMSVENPTIKVNGNNLFNNDTSLIEQIFYTSTSGTQTSSYGYIVNLPVGTYTVKSFSKVPPSDTHLYYIYAAIIDENNVVQKGTGQVVVNSTTSTFTFTIEKGQRYFIYDAETAGLTQAKKVFSLYDIQLAKGESVTKYEPYEEELITIDETTPFGKNLFKTTNYEKGTIDSASGNISTNTGARTYCLITDYIYLKSGAYVLSNKTGANLRYICFYDIDKGFKNATWTNRKKTFKFTVTEDCYVRIDVERDANVAIGNFDIFLNEYEFMLHEGMNTLPFEPYIPPIITMRGIGDYKDRIYTKDGKVWFERNIKYYNPTPSISTATNKETAGLNWWKEDEKNYPLCTITNWNYVYTTEQMSNIGAYSVDYKKTGKLHWYITKYGSHLIPPDEETWTNATDANEYFMGVTGNIPMEYQYVLATPIITEITGSLAEKILAIDKSKNITIYSDNGVYGSTEVVD